MPLPASWVDHLFAKLGVRYGAAFMRQWPDTAPDLVKADWAEVLDNVRAESISYALKYLPEKPPNAIQFRDICRRAPAPSDLARLQAPVPQADPDRVKAIMARLGAPDDAHMPMAERCARKILEISETRGGVLSMPQRQQLQAMGYLQAGAVE